jgi:hypothetical protein
VRAANLRMPVSVGAAAVGAVAVGAGAKSVKSKRAGAGVELYGTPLLTRERWSRRGTAGCDQRKVRL